MLSLEDSTMSGSPTEEVGLVFCYSREQSHRVSGQNNNVNNEQKQLQ
jgi:hypothetical protein